MKLYLLYVSYQYEGGYVHGVFSTREEAEKYKNEDYISGTHYAHIKEIYVDKFEEIAI